MKICPNCKGKRFIVTAHVTQSWVVDENGSFIEQVSSADEVTHSPDDDDIWVCQSCGYDAPGRDFRWME